MSTFDMTNISTGLEVRTHDMQGRPYIRLSEIKAGTRLQLDIDFDCVTPGQIYVARMDENGEPFIKCRDGEHELSIQAEGNGDYCIGVYAAPEVAD